MLTINHTICPECSIGCGLNVISKDGIIVGINPFKNHEINEGKNCKNCKQYIDKVSTIQDKTFDYENTINNIKNKLVNTDNNKITIITSGNTDNNDLDNLINFADKRGYDLFSYEYELTNIRWVADGGDTFQASVINGVFYLEGKIDPEDIILILSGKGNNGGDGFVIAHTLTDRTVRVFLADGRPDTEAAVNACSQVDQDMFVTAEEFPADRKSVV